MIRFLAVALAVFFATVPARAGWDWPTSFTESVSPELSALHSELHRLRLDAATPGFAVANATFRADSFRVTLVDGTLFEEAPLEGLPRGAFFQGRAVVTFEPGSRTARDALRDQWGEETLREVPVDWIYLFSLREKGLGAEILSGRGNPLEWTGSSDYAGAKKALRMSGLRLLHAYLNRQGRSKDTVFAVFAPAALRRKETESFFLYAYDPNDLYEVSLQVFGNAGAIYDPFGKRALEFDETLKFLWWDVAVSSASPSVFKPHGRVAKYTSTIRVSKGVRSAALETTIDLDANPGVAALAFDLSPRMQVRAVSLPDGSSLPFAQWKDAPESRNVDTKVVVLLPEPLPAGTRLTVRVEAEGPLFDAFRGGMRQADEDLWKPRFNDPEGSVHELRVTVPKNLRAVSAGRIVSEEVVGGERHVHFLSSRPLNDSTFYVGPFDAYEAEADGVKITLLHAPAEEEAWGFSYDKPTYAVEEVANAVRVYNRLLGVPLDLKDLRVATTPTGHGRGFEGMILLSKYGGTGGSSGADLFRAHEVAHQWWGGMVNSKRWPEDRWITESFAEYMAMEYYDIRFQKPEKTLQQIREQWVDPLWMQTDTKTVTVTGEPVALRTGGRALTDGGLNVYTKGALVVRHLEYLFRVQKKGEGAFWELLTEFLKSNLYKPVTTEDFIAAAEKKIGGKLDWFWNQWVYGEGLPSVRWDHEVAPHPEGGWVLTVNVRQEGTDFVFPVPVRVDTGGEKPLETHVAVRGKEGGRLQVRLRDKPKRVTLNDEWRAPIEIRN